MGQRGLEEARQRSISIFKIDGEAENQAMAAIMVVTILAFLVSGGRQLVETRSKPPMSKCGKCLFNPHQILDFHHVILGLSVPAYLGLDLAVNMGDF